MKSKFIAIYGLLSLLFCSTVSAQNTADDFFRSTGKLNTVLGVVVILFVVLIFFLIRLDRKLSKLEKNLDNE